MNKTDKPYTCGLVTYGKVIRFSDSPYGQHLRLVDGKVIWKLDDLLNDFEDKNICVTIELKKRHGKSKETQNTA